MTNKPKATTKRQVGPKPEGHRKLIGLSERDAIATLKAVCEGSPNALIPYAFSTVFEDWFEFREYSSLNVEQKSQLKVYKENLERARNDLAAALSTIDDR